MMWNHWKIFDKMTEDLNYDLFGGPKWPGNWASGPIFDTPLKLTQIDMCTQTDAKPVELFWENDQRREFWLIRGPKNWASEAHILHTYEENGHGKQYCCETSENFLRKWPNTTNLSYLGAQNGPEIGPLRGTYFTYLWQQLQGAYKARLTWIQSKLFNKIFKYSKTSLRWRHNDHAGVSNHQPRDCLLNRLFRRRSKKTSKLRVTGLCVGNSQMFPFDDVIMLILTHLEAQNGPKIWASGAFILHSYKSSSNELVNQVSS